MLGCVLSPDTFPRAFEGWRPSLADRVVAPRVELHLQFARALAAPGDFPEQFGPGFEHVLVPHDLDGGLGSVIGVQGAPNSHDFDSFERLQTVVGDRDRVEPSAHSALASSQLSHVLPK